MTETYFEMSPRRSGKTTRLVQAMFEHVREGNDAFFFNFNEDMTDIVKGQLKLLLFNRIGEQKHKRERRWYSPSPGPGAYVYAQKYGLVYSIYNTNEIMKKVPTDLRGLTFENPRLFVDNVDCMYTTRQKCPIVPSAYYTASFFSGIDLKELLRHTKGKYTTYATHDQWKDSPESNELRVDLWPESGGVIPVRSRRSIKY